jgi:hypothetical protein
VTKPTRSTLLIVHHKLDVKGWIAQPPSPEAARPGMCPRCARASRPTGGRLGLHGHGFRDREILGPPDAHAAPAKTLVGCRRYRCSGCKAIILVVPRGVAPRRHYGLAVVAMALALWAVAQRRPLEVRERICVAQGTVWGTEWPTLRCWARAARASMSVPAAFTLREVAGRAAQIAIGRAPPSLRTAPLWAQAFAGGQAMP